VPGGLVVANADDRRSARFVAASRRPARGRRAGAGGLVRAAAPRSARRPCGPTGSPDRRAAASADRQPASGDGRDAAGDGRTGSVEVRLPLHGAYNVDNALAAACRGMGARRAARGPRGRRRRARAVDRPRRRPPPGRRRHRSSTTPTTRTPRRCSLALDSAAELPGERPLGGPRRHARAGARGPPSTAPPVATPSSAASRRWYGVGELSREIAAGAGEAAGAGRWFATAAEAAEAVAGEIADGDVRAGQGVARRRARPRRGEARPRRPGRAGVGRRSRRGGGA
jgi:hypothetical protein